MKKGKRKMEPRKLEKIYSSINQAWQEIQQKLAELF